MEYREIEAPSYEAAFTKIKKLYGDNVKIINRKEINKGGFLGFGGKKFVKVTIGMSDADLLRKYKENLGIQNKFKTDNRIENNIAENKSIDNNSITMSYVLEKLEKIEKGIDKKIFKDEGLHPNLVELKDILLENEFFDDYVNELIEALQESLSYNKINDRLEVHKFAYDYIKGKLVTPVSGKKKIEKSIYILVGPTGVGKTTTVAKIAANAIREKLSVELVTIDGYRIGAKYQLEKYAEYMRTPVSGVEDNVELQKIIDLSDADLILIDTIGRSAKDDMNLVKMKQMLKLVNHRPEFILTLSASVKPNEVKKIFKSFDMFEYSSVIITKLDESETIGAILNCAIDKKVEIKYITTGQRVPNDIEKATLDNLMSMIKGLDTEVYLTNVN
jgi:flagellar biosynthesis protein FlhF